jgi:lantibiotic modifying enzyme
MNLTQQARQRGFFGFESLLPREVYKPGFFNGTSGIGYLLLRIVAPDRLPAVLRCE